LIRNKAILPHKTLIILDEIQECPNALGCLKYFNEEAIEYNVITAGSLLGTYLAKPASYPVGKVNLLNVYPLSFEEYLAAVRFSTSGYLKNGAITDVPLYLVGKTLELITRFEAECQIFL
jgi:predicted AAA+ superfamily ATPase